MYSEKFNFSIGAIITTVICSILLLAAAVVMWFEIAVLTAITYLFLAVLAVWILFSMPRYLIVSKSSIIITHPIGQTVIAKSEIVEVRALSSQDIKGSVRIFASGGCFGWFGLFKNGTLGKYRLYSGDLKNLYLIATKGKRYVISSTKPIEL